MYIYFGFWFFSLASAFNFRSKLAQLVFIAMVFVFVGLRFETAFDWLFYKDSFEAFQASIAFEFAQWFAEYYQIELGYVLLMALTGQVFPGYEYLQALVTLTFLASIMSLCRAFGVRNVALVIALAATFLLLTLMMSIVRQCLAVAIFNFALSAAVARRRILMVALLALATTIHVSTLFYVLALVFALAQPLRMPSLRDIALIVIAGVVVFINLGIFADYLPTYLANRFFAYGVDQIILNFSLWQLYYVILSVFVIAYTVFGGSPAENPRVRTIILRRMIVALAVMCLCAVLINVVRDRVSYEMFLLFALYLAHENVRLAAPARIATVTLGLFFSILNVLAAENRIVFAPYQNVIGVGLTGDTGDGRARYKAFQERFERLKQQ